MAFDALLRARIRPPVERERFYLERTRELWNSGSRPLPKSVDALRTRLREEHLIIAFAAQSAILREENDRGGDVAGVPLSESRYRTTMHLADRVTPLLWRSVDTTSNSSAKPAPALSASPLRPRRPRKPATQY